MNKITIPSGTKYLSDIMKELPINCLFDKGRVGCGGTTLALTNDKPYVIVVPFISLIESKVAQHSTLLGVTGTTTSNELKKYLQEAEVPKIMVTYDSLPKVMKCISPSKFNLLVDEYHLLFTQYSFRGDSAIKGVLKHYSEFKEYCFMTATVLEEEFILDELSTLPIVVAEWEDVREVVVNSIQCTGSISQTVINIIRNFITGKVEGNAYIFVNSVDFIKELVKACDLNNTNARAIWGKSNKKETGLNRGFSIDLPKKINLLTSTCFEGVDFYDEEGKIFIISDGMKAHTLTDISTSFQQIAGRIRNTKYWEQINHLFSTTKYCHKLNYGDYKKVVEKAIIEDERNIEEYNRLSESARIKINIEVNTNYINKVDNKFIFDSNKVKIDLHNFKVTKSLYSLRINVSNELKSKGFNVIEHTFNIKNEVKIVEKEKTFKETVIELKNLEYKESDYDILEIHRFNTPLHIAAFDKYSFLQNILSDRKNGFNIIEEHKYHVGNLKRRQIKLLSISFEMKVFKLLRLSGKISEGSFITASDAKSLFTDIYKDLEIKKSALGSHLNEYFETKAHTQRVKGKPTNGYIIKTPKVIFQKQDSLSS
jgi:hypothetical protein